MINWMLVDAKIVQKLGHGASSTVWLLEIAVSTNMLLWISKNRSSPTYTTSLVSILKHLSKVKSDHPGRLYSSASLFSRNFWIVGPNVKYVDPASRA